MLSFLSYIFLSDFMIRKGIHKHNVNQKSPCSKSQKKNAAEELF